MFSILMAFQKAKLTLASVLQLQKSILCWLECFVALISTSAKLLESVISISHGIVSLGNRQRIAEECVFNFQPQKRPDANDGLIWEQKLIL